MTVCIAAYSPLTQIFVAVTDTKVCNDVQSADAAMFKASPLTDDAGWFALYTAENYVEPDALVRGVTSRLKGAASVRLDEVLAAIAEAYQAETARRCDAHLAPLGLSRAQFLATGRDAFGPDEFARRLDDLEAYARINTDLLICGFDSDGGHICSVDRAGLTSVHDKLGFHAIGAGAWIALEWLYLDPKFRLSPNLADTIYRVCAAKFAAESAPSVGQDTIALLRGAGAKDALFLFGHHFNRLRELWRRQVLSYPSDAIVEISTQLHQAASDHAAAVEYLKRVAPPSSSGPKQ